MRDAEFMALYRQLVPYYGEDDEMSLINGVGNAAEGDYFGIVGRRKQIEWMKEQLEAYESVADHPPSEDA